MGHNNGPDEQAIFSAHFCTDLPGYGKLDISYNGQNDSYSWGRFYENLGAASAGKTKDQIISMTASCNGGGRSVLYVFSYASPCNTPTIHFRAVTKEEVLKAIRTAQDSERNSYEHALGEIRAGEKRSHWIWWVWPSLGPVRTTRKPKYDLPDLETARCYIRDPTLRQRLIEITQAAVEHLSRGSSPKTVFGKSIDVVKFQETATYFAVLSAVEGDAEMFAVFRESLYHAYAGKLDQNTMKYVGDHIPRCRRAVAIEDLDTIIGAGDAVGD